MKYLILFLFMTMPAYGLIDANTPTRGQSIVVDEEICADTGDANASTLTITPRDASMVLITNSDANGCDLTLGETNVAVGHEVTITVVSNAGGTVDITDASGVYEGAGNTTLDIYDVVSIQYADDRWIEVSESNN